MGVGLDENSMFAADLFDQTDTYVTGSVHNMYLKVLFEAGLPALIGLMIIQLATLRAGMQLIVNTRDTELYPVAVAAHRRPSWPRSRGGAVRPDPRSALFLAADPSIWCLWSAAPGGAQTAAGRGAGAAGRPSSARSSATRATRCEAQRSGVSWRASDRLASRHGQALRVARSADARQRPGQRLRAAGRHDHAVVAVHHQPAGRAAGRRRDHREAGGRGLVDHDPPRLEAAGQHQAARPGQQPRQVVGLDEAEHVHPGQSRPGGTPAGRCRRPAAARDRPPRRGRTGSPRRACRCPCP